MYALTPPQAVLFDWQNTLVSTMDALYNAMDDTLMELKPQMGLADNALADYVRECHCLPEDVKISQKMSRTDLFHTIFADAEEREKTSELFNRCYHKHFEDVHALNDEVGPMLQQLKDNELKIGVVTNRARDFIDHELDAVGWGSIFDVVVAVGDGYAKKPSSEPLLAAVDKLGMQPGKHIWFMGDGKSDMQCGLGAGVTTVFYHFTRWSESELATMFPTPEDHPDIMVHGHGELYQLVVS